MRRVVITTVRPLDAIVVLGCRVADGPLRGAAARRAARAAQAWKEGVAPWILASGGRRWNGLSEADGLAKALVEQGVDPSSVSRELCSLSTLENAWYSARVLNARSARKIGLVTCDWHMPRAAHCFRSVSLDIVPLPAETPGRSWRLLRHLREAGARWFDERAARTWHET